MLPRTCRRQGEGRLSAQGEYGPRFAWRRRPAAVLGAQLGDAPDQRGVGRRQSVLVQPHVVLKPGPAMAAELERPPVERELILADAGAKPLELPEG